MWSRRLGRPSLQRVVGIDSHDVGALRSASRRTRFLQLGLACAAVALLLAAAASARDPETRERGLLPSGTTGVVVLDLSLSIADEDYLGVRRTLRRLIAEKARIGLVAFSDVPYELFPPGTPALELRPLLRLLVVPQFGPANNPWIQSFRAGTRISSALELARTMLERDGVENGSILLVSDLETAPDDVQALARTVEGLRRSDISLRVVPLNPSSDALVIFQGLLGEEGFAASPASDYAEAIPTSSKAKSPTPVAFLLLGLGFFLALAAHERFAGRLGLPVRQGVGGRP